jgi:dethiobiotin synthetase
MTSRIFVTGTDTGAGKTYVTTALVHALREAGKDAVALKPVACGHEENTVNSDVSALLRAQGLPDEAAREINLYSFHAPLAPSQAAAREGLHIDRNRLIDWCREKSACHAMCLVEGVGGLMVPLAEDYLVSDWLLDLPDFEVLLVVRARLGGINHALLTLDKLNRMGRPPRWVIINDADGVGRDMVQMHQDALEARMTTIDSQICLPYGMGFQKLANTFQQELPSLFSAAKRNIRTSIHERQE